MLLSSNNVFQKQNKAGHLLKE